MSFVSGNKDIRSRKLLGNILWLHSFNMQAPVCETRLFVKTVKVIIHNVLVMYKFEKNQEAYHQLMFYEYFFDCPPNIFNIVFKGNMIINGLRHPHNSSPNSIISFQIYFL